MGHIVGFDRREAAYNAALEMGFDSEDAMGIVNGMAECLQRNRPYEALDFGWHGKKIDLTGAYRLMAHLLTPAFVPRREKGGKG